MAMETRILGRTGLEVGVIGLGTEHLTFNRENMDAVLNMAVPAGVNFHKDRHPQRLRKVWPQGDFVPAGQVWGVIDDAGLGVQRPRRAAPL